MDSGRKIPMIALIAGELMCGIALSLVFLKLVFATDNFFGDTYGSGIFRFYGGLSVVFFIAVFSVGIFGAHKLGETNKVRRAVIYSFLFWVLSLIIYTMTFNFFSYTLNLRMIPLYIILVGIIVGFNIGMKLKSTSESDVR